MFCMCNALERTCPTPGKLTKGRQLKSMHDTASSMAGSDSQSSIRMEPGWFVEPQPRAVGSIRLDRRLDLLFRWPSPLSDSQF